MRIYIVILLLFFLGHAFSLPTQALNSLNSMQLQEALQTPVEYTLPYPGVILPNSPFYLFKTLRDRVVSLFITDIQKRGEFDLLQADKRLAEGQYLLHEGSTNDKIISDTISKGENYFGEAIQNSITAKKEGRLENDFLDKLGKAGIKHEQVLYDMSTKTHGALHQNLLLDITRIQELENQVSKLKSIQ